MANSDYKITAAGNFAHTGLLAAPITYLTATITLKDLNHPDEDMPAAGWAILMEEEVMRVVSVAGTTYTVLRGCADTIPQPHGINARAWFLDDAVGSNDREYAGGDQVGVKILPFLPLGARLPIEKAAPHGLTMNYRFWRPYPPGQMRANSARWYQPANLDVDQPVCRLTWVHRNRITQVDQLVGHDEANVAPEPGQLCIMRVYNHQNALVRTETGLPGQVFDYTWAQAINDFGAGTTETNNIIVGSISFTSIRQGFDGWQAYTIPLYLNTRAPMMLVAQVAEQTAQESDDTALRQGIYVGQLAEQTAQDDPMPTAARMLTAQAVEEIGQLTAFYTPLTRMVVEAPYTRLLRQGRNPLGHHVMTMTARPSDRLTDNHRVYTQLSDLHPWEEVDYPPFTPWLTIDADLSYLGNIVPILQTSLTDGVPLDNVRVGQMAAITGEIVRVVEITETHIRLARGCADTVPAIHPRRSRIWFFEAGQGLNRPDMSYDPAAEIPTRIVPAVYGPPLDPMMVPPDTVELAQRVDRPFPPGELLVNGLPWFNGARATPGQSIIFTWVQRNRLTQGTQVVDHHAADNPHEQGTRYRISIYLKMRDGANEPIKVYIRDELVDGRSYVYSYDKAVVDGQRAAAALKVCGYVTVPFYIDAVRDDLENWQGYAVPLMLPAPACPVNQPPGGGQGPNPDTPGGGPDGGTDGGNGNNNGGNNGGTTPPDDNGPQPPDPKPPVIPPEWPPIPPDPIDPQQPGQPNPTDTTPDPDDDGEHWDYTWDIHWDAYRRYGGNDQGEG